MKKCPNRANFFVSSIHSLGVVVLGARSSSTVAAKNLGPDKLRYFLPLFTGSYTSLPYL